MVSMLSKNHVSSYVFNRCKLKILNATEELLASASYQAGPFASGCLLQEKIQGDLDNIVKLHIALVYSGLHYESVSSCGTGQCK